MGFLIDIITTHTEREFELEFKQGGRHEILTEFWLNFVSFLFCRGLKSGLKSIAEDQSEP